MAIVLQPGDEIATITVTDADATGGYEDIAIGSFPAVTGRNVTVTLKIWELSYNISGSSSLTLAAITGSEDGGATWPHNFGSVGPQFGTGSALFDEGTSGEIAVSFGNVTDLSQIQIRSRITFVNGGATFTSTAEVTDWEISYQTASMPMWI